jgi:hypothetical protein
VRLGTVEEILGRSATEIDTHALGLQFPACDWSGYFLFAVLDGDGGPQALNLGLLIGHMNGADLNMPHMVGDPRRITVIRSLVHDGRSYRSPDETTYTRRDLVYSRAGLDVQVGDAARIRGSWPDFELYFADPVHDVVYELAGRARHVHWMPDHVYSNAYSYVVFPDFAFSGTVTVRGEAHAVTGVGALDHVCGRSIVSPSSPGVGFWQYDPTVWEGGLVSNGLYFVGADGAEVVAAGATTLPDGGYHPARRFTIEHLEVAEAGPNSGLPGGASQVAPRRWRATLETGQGTLVYEAEAVEVADPAGNPLREANVLYRAEGVLSLDGGGELAVRGRGYNEYMGGTRP